MHRSNMDPTTDSDRVSRRKDGDDDVSPKDDCEDFEARMEKALALGDQTSNVSDSAHSFWLNTGMRPSETMCRMGGWNAWHRVQNSSLWKGTILFSVGSEYIFQKKLCANFEKTCRVGDAEMNDDVGARTTSCNQ